MHRIDLPRAANPRVSIIIPAAAGAELLVGCLTSLARCGPTQIPYETIVVLNAAKPETELLLRDKVTGVEVIASPVNLGMAGAGNLGRAAAQGELLVTLHDDAAIEEGWLEALVEIADTHPEAGAVGGKVLFPDGRLQNAGMILWRDGTTSLPWVGEAPSPSSFENLRAVDYCGTSSLLVRGAAWDEVGGLDERFYPAYYADVDLSMGLRQHGWVVLYQPQSRIRHHQGASASLRFRYYITARNRRRFLEKWSAALEAHEPPETNSRAAVERAMARAEAFAAEGTKRWRLGMASATQREPLDRESQQRRHIEMSNELYKSYAADLVELLDAAESDRDRLARLLAEKEGELARWRSADGA